MRDLTTPPRAPGPMTVSDALADALPATERGQDGGGGRTGTISDRFPSVCSTSTDRFPSVSSMFDAMFNVLFDEMFAVMFDVMFGVDGNRHRLTVFRRCARCRARWSRMGGRGGPAGSRPRLRLAGRCSSSGTGGSPARTSETNGAGVGGQRDVRCGRRETTDMETQKRTPHDKITSVMARSKTSFFLPKNTSRFIQ